MPIIYKKNKYNFLYCSSTNKSFDLPIKKAKFRTCSGLPDSLTTHKWLFCIALVRWEQREMEIASLV